MRKRIICPFLSFHQVNAFMLIILSHSFSALYVPSDKLIEVENRIMIGLQITNPCGFQATNTIGLQIMKLAYRQQRNNQKFNKQVIPNFYLNMFLLRVFCVLLIKEKYCIFRYEKFTWTGGQPQSCRERKSHQNPEYLWVHSKYYCCAERITNILEYNLF